MIQKMFTFHGSPPQFRAFRALSSQYNLDQKKLSEFSELDKIVFQNIKKFAGFV